MRDFYYSYLKVKRLSRKIFNHVHGENTQLIEDFNELRGKFYAQLWMNSATKIGASCEDLGDNYFRIKRKSKTTYVNQHNVMLDKPDHHSIQ